MNYLGNGVYIFPSQSKNTPQSEYCVDINENSCDCPDYQFRRDKPNREGHPQDCKHLTKAKLLDSLWKHIVKKQKSTL